MFEFCITEAAFIYIRFVTNWLLDGDVFVGNWKHTEARARTYVSNICNVCMYIYSLHKFGANEITNMKWHVQLKWSTQTPTKESFFCLDMPYIYILRI